MAQTPSEYDKTRRLRDAILEARRLLDSGDRSALATIDLWWEEDARPDMPMVAGIYAIGQRLYRRLVTPRGFFPFWPNEGLGISKYLLSKPPLWVVKTEVEAECKRDQQVENVIVTPQLTSNKTLLLIDIFFTTPFGAADLTMTATEAAATLISLQKAT